MSGKEPESLAPLREDPEALRPASWVSRLLRVAVCGIMFLFALSCMPFLLARQSIIKPMGQFGRLGWFEQRLLLLRAPTALSGSGLSTWEWPNMNLALWEGGDRAFFQMLGEGVTVDVNGDEGKDLLQIAVTTNNAKTANWLLDRRKPDAQELEELFHMLERSAAPNLRDVRGTTVEEDSDRIPVDGGLLERLRKAGESARQPGEDEDAP